jgi:FixJ family two-component response regulator
VSENPAEHTLIAVVDDEDCVRASVGRLLRAHGYLVEGHASGAGFLDSLKLRRPTVVLLDLHMPETNGFDVLKALRTQPDNPPVLVVTANLTPAAAMRASELGAVECLSKPVESAVLLDAIGAALRSKRCR